MDQKSIQEMKKGFATAYIDGNLASNAEYIPSFISNKPEAGKKVIASLEDEMLKCDKFQLNKIAARWPAKVVAQLSFFQ